jgi:hypothetical protein
MSDKAWTRPFPPGHHLHFSPLRRMQQAKDSDGNLYDILVQNEEMSCGLAASAMLIDLYWAFCDAGAMDAEARLKKIAAKFPGSLVESDKLWAVGKDFGSTADNIEQLLKSQGIPITGKDARWLNVNSATPIIQIGLLQEPAMVLFGWYLSGLPGPRSGGHFAVAARATKQGNIVILDPWDGSLSEIQSGLAYHSKGYPDCVLYTG